MPEKQPPMIAEAQMKWERDPTCIDMRHQPGSAHYTNVIQHVPKVTNRAKNHLPSALPSAQGFASHPTNNPRRNASTSAAPSTPAPQKTPNTPSHVSPMTASGSTRQPHTPCMAPLRELILHVAGAEDGADELCRQAEAAQNTHSGAPGGVG